MNPAGNPTMPARNGVGVDDLKPAFPFLPVKEATNPDPENSVEIVDDRTFGGTLVDHQLLQ